MNWIPAFVAIPLGAAFLIPLIEHWIKGSSDFLTNAVTAFLMGLTLSFIHQAAQTQVYFVGGWEPAEGIPFGIALVVDGLSVLMLLVVNSIAFFATLYSVKYMARYTDKGKFFTLFMLMLAGMNGVVIAGDLFNMFVFLEITAIASYALVAFGIGSEELEASFKYQVLGGTASALVLFGIAIFYMMTKTLNFADASRVIAATGVTPALLFVSVLFLVGFGLKSALMPFHAWLPDAHPSAPAPISAMLSGVVIKVLGVYTLVRIFFNVIGIGTIPALKTVLLSLGVISMVAGAFLALGQQDMKRLLAYSSISQVGYIIFAFGLGTELGILGGLFHLMNHSVLKSLLFLNSGAVVYETESRDMEKLGGLMHKMPVTGTTSMIASLSMSGLPPLGGFFSKLIIIWASIDAGYPLLGAVAVIASIVTLAYYFKLQKEVFLGKLADAFQKAKEAPVLMCIPMICLAIISVGLGLLLLDPVREMVLTPAVHVIQGGVDYARMVLGG
ncbi:NADH/ubiquinone/plastoquinone (complex I) [bacterium]|nr:NADH/ubiquinone/plastoquinone (complex I) [bacterium]